MALGATAAIGFAGSAEAAPAAHHYQASIHAPAAASCSAGYTSAYINGVHKCLRAGEFCTHGADSQYRKYGFRCIHYYRNVHRYRLTYA